MKTDISNFLLLLLASFSKYLTPMENCYIFWQRPPGFCEPFLGTRERNRSYWNIPQKCGWITNVVTSIEIRKSYPQRHLTQMTFFFFFWSHCVAYGTSLTKDRTLTPAMEVHSLNHWATWEVLLKWHLIQLIYRQLESKDKSMEETTY